MDVARFQLSFIAKALDALSERAGWEKATYLHRDPEEVGSSALRRGECLSRNGRSAPADDKGYYEKNDRNDKKHVSDPGGFTRRSAETKNFSNDRNDKEN
jgi:hypothetical protein